MYGNDSIHTYLILDSGQVKKKAESYLNDQLSHTQTDTGDPLTLLAEEEEEEDT